MTEESKRAWFENYDLKKCLQPFKYKGQTLPCGTCENCRRAYYEAQKQNTKETR